jgi:serine/threonine-protein kinase RsbW
MAHYQYKIPSDIEQIAPVIDDLEFKWRQREIDEKTIFALHLALEETMTNAVVHGNKSNPGLIVTIDCYDLDRAIELIVSDQGQGFNPDEIANPTLENNIAKPRGRGLFIIKNFMDSVEFSANGSSIKIRKLLCQSASTLCDNTPQLFWEWEKGKSVSVIHLAGSLNIDSVSYFKKEIEKFPASGKLVIDFTTLCYIDSTGLSCLLTLRQRQEENKGLLRLAALQERVKSVFETTRLNLIFSIYPTVSAAREGF